MTEVLKGTLEGMVPAILAGQSAYGQEITAWLRAKGFSDIAAGTVYALLVRVEQRGLVDVEKCPSEKRPDAGIATVNGFDVTTDRLQASQYPPCRLDVSRRPYASHVLSSSTSACDRSLSRMAFAFITTEIPASTAK